MRIGIFGGTFDPVHWGHLLLAECGREHCGLDEVWFVPAAVNPHKQHLSTTPHQSRAEMLHLAIGGHPAFRVSEVEFERGGLSYTVDTVERIAATRPNDELVLLMGADTFWDFPTWRQPARICHLASLAFVERPGQAPVDLELLRPFATNEQLERMESYRVRMPQIDLSSSEIRDRVRVGRSIRYRTPRAVEMYIQAQGLYRSDNPS